MSEKLKTAYFAAAGGTIGAVLVKLLLGIIDWGLLLIFFIPAIVLELHAWRDRRGK